MFNVTLGVENFKKIYKEKSKHLHVIIWKKMKYLRIYL